MYKQEGEKKVRKDMKKWLFGMALLVVPLLITAQEQKDSTQQVKQNGKAGRLEISDKNWDFGFIPRGAKVTHNFLVKNIGNDTLKITNVRKTCGCTTAPIHRDVLLPGDTTTLEVTFNSGSYQGPIQKTVYVESNDPIQPFMDIGFSATVAVPASQLTFDPLMVNFDTVHAVPTKAILKVTNMDSNSVSFSVLEAPAGFAALKAKRKKLSAGKETELEVNLKNPPAGEFNTSFTLVCNDAKKTRYTIPIHGFYPQPK